MATRFCRSRSRLTASGSRPVRTTRRSRSGTLRPGAACRRWKAMATWFCRSRYRLTASGSRPVRTTRRSRSGTPRPGAACKRFMSVLEISFDQTDHRYLHTDIGRIQMETAITESSIKHGYSLGGDRSWITCNGQHVLWLPSETRPECFAVQGQMISIGCASGRVLVIGFSRDV